MMRQTDGFTMIELIVVISIMAIIAVIAAPQFRPNKLAGAARMVFADIQYARMEAITKKHNVRVLLKNASGCHTADGHTYKIHYDTDEDGVCDGGEDIATKDIHTDFDGVTLSADANPSFNPVGTLNPGTDAGTVTLTEGSDSRSVEFSWTGRISIQ